MVVEIKISIVEKNVRKTERFLTTTIYPSIAEIKSGFNHLEDLSPESCLKNE